MENKKEMDKVKRRKAVPVLLVIMVLMVIGTSFALWNLTFRQTGTNVVTSGCFKVEYVNESDAIMISDAYPTTDIEGKKMVPYKFTITNKCDSVASYYINLETISSGDKVLDEKYLKANLTTTDEEVFLDNLKDEYINQEKVISTATKAFKLGEGTLQGNESKNYDLRLWLDEDTPLSENTMNRTYQGKITVLATNISLARTMIAMDAVISGNTATNNTYTQNGKYKLSKISFEDKITTLENITETVDFSQDKNRSVLGHYVKDNDTDTYSLHIQSNGKIEANKDATAYFVYTPVSDETVIFEGIENIDTKNVENMNYMFYNYNGTTLDLRSFDTSNVTTMQFMFYGCNNLNSLNLGNFNTPNLVSMRAMFCGCKSLNSLDLSNFNTSQVTNMSNIFNNCRSLTNLDISSFDASRVADMGYMFADCRNLTSLDLTQFDTSSVNNMGYMFYNCYKLTTTITIKKLTREYTNMFESAATEENAKITVNFTTETSKRVDEMIVTKNSSNSNVVKGSLVS